MSELLAKIEEVVGLDFSPVEPVLFRMEAKNKTLSIADFARVVQQIKEMGFFVKLDTNGYRPDVLKKMLDLKTVDFVSMDIKTALNEEKYKKAAGIPKIEIDKVLESIKILMNSHTDYEFRTSVISEFVSKEDVFEIAGHIKKAKTAFLYF